MKATNQISRLLRNRRGSVAVEFALIGLVSLELLTESMQAGLYFYTSAAVERATWSSSRQLLTGSIAGQGLTAAQFRANVLCPVISSTHLSCGNLVTNIQTINEGVNPSGFYSLVNASKTGLIVPPFDNTQTSYCVGTSGSYVFMQILYAMPVFSPIWKVFATNFNGSPSYIIQSTAAFKNEPFQTSNATC